MAATATTSSTRTPSGRGRRPRQGSPAAAAGVLRARLMAVQLCLRGVAAGHVSRDDVHELRVATRRASAAVDIVRTLMPRRCRRWLERSLRRIRRAAGPVRDLDLVAAADLPTSFVEVVGRRRARAGRRLQACARRFRVDLWRNTAAEAVDAVAEAPSASVIRRHVHRRLRSISVRFVKRADRRLRRGRSLHRLRIAGKKLRYALELSAAIVRLPRSDEGEVVLRRIQDRFGTATDDAAVAAFVRHWADDDADRESRRALVAAQERASKRARKAKRACVDWWTSARRERVLRQLAAAIAGRSA